MSWFSAEQKAKIVLEVLQNETTINQVASKYEIAPKVIISWKKHFLENAYLAFESANGELARQLGKTKIERDNLELHTSKIKKYAFNGANT